MGQSNIGLSLQYEVSGGIEYSRTQEYEASEAENSTCSGRPTVHGDQEGRTVACAIWFAVFDDLPLR